MAGMLLRNENDTFNTGWDKEGTAQNLARRDVASIILRQRLTQAHSLWP
jgi:hypothetical protein